MQFARRTAMLVVALLTAGVGLLALTPGPAASATVVQPAPPPSAEPAPENMPLTNVKVLDAQGNAFPQGTAGLIACPLEGWSVPCTHLLVGIADANGVAQLNVSPTVQYRFSGFVTNTGWSCPGFVSEDGNEFWFSDNVDAFGRALARPTTFVIREPDPSECAGIELTLTVLDGAGNPFPQGTAGMLACPVDGWSVPCTHLLVGSADANGVTKIVVDPNVQYRFTGFVTNRGWPCPGFVSEDGTEFWFSDPIDAFGGELADGMTFVVHEPDPAQCQ
jgi:hypothetical protein